MFINRSAVMFNSYTNGKNVEKIVNSMVSTIDKAEMDRDLAKFKQDQKYYTNSCPDNNGFSRDGSCLKKWANDRDPKVLQEYQEEFGLSGTVSVSIGATGNGTVLMEGMKLPSASFKGKFFGGVKMELKAVPDAGAVFTGWSDGVTDNPRLVSPTDGSSFTAKFQ